MTFLSDQEVHELEGQVIWPHAFVEQTLNRTEMLDTDFAQLYRRVFQFYQRLDLHIPRLPLAEPKTHQEQSASEPGPQLSIVVTTRNDTHSHRMQERTQSFIDNIEYLSAKFEKGVELVIVEWNPPADRSPLIDQFTFDRSHPFLSVKVITVGQDIHDQYEMAKTTPLYQMIAKNVGVRRATGEFILATNIDVLFSENLFRHLVSGRLEKGTLYRSHRCDIDHKILDVVGAEQQLDQAEPMALRIHYQEGPTAPGQERSKLLTGAPKLSTEKIDFLESEDRTKLEVHCGLYRVGWHTLPALHYQQCGDFQMMHRRDWHRVRGYMELDGFIFHLDSLLAIVADHSGIKEEVFPDDCLHYHIDHKMGVEQAPGEYETGSGKMLSNLSVFELWAIDRYMAYKGRAVDYNHSNWGCSDVNFATVSFGGGRAITKQPGALVQNHQKACFIDPGDAVGVNKQAVESAMERARQAQKFFADHILASVDRPIWIWGAGGRGRYLHHLLSERGVVVNGFLTSQLDGVPDLDGVPISEGLQAVENQQVFIIIASIFAEEIRQNLVQAGLSEGEDFVVGP